MAAEAPITAKKGEYSGLSSADILALFSGRHSYKAEYVIFRFPPCPPLALDRSKHRDGGAEDVAAKRAHRCRGGKWRNGKSHVTNHLGRIHPCFAVAGEEDEGVSGANGPDKSISP